MTAMDFRRQALALEGAEEGSHQGHPDFRVGGKVFASLGPDGTWAMVRIDPELQAAVVIENPDAFEAFAGAWGRQGCTKVILSEARAARVEELLRHARDRRAG